MFIINDLQIHLLVSFEHSDIMKLKRADFMSNEGRKNGQGLIILFILIINCMGQCGIDIYLPSVPDIINDFGCSPSLIQLSLNIYLFTFAISQLIYGPLSDHLGRRLFTLVGIIIFILGSLTCALAGNAYGFIAGRIIQGLGIGATSVNARGIMRDVFEGRRLIKVSTYSIMFWAIIPILAPILGGYLKTFFGWKSTFFALAIHGSIMLVLSYYLLPETCAHVRSHSMKLPAIAGRYYSLLSDRVFMGFTLTCVFIFSIFSAFNSISPLLFQQNFGLSSVVFGWTVSFIGSGYFLGSYINSVLVKFFDPYKTLFVGFGIALFIACFISLLTILDLVSVPFIAIPLFILYMGMGLTYPQCMAGALNANPKIAGTAGALFGTLVFTGSSIVGTLSSLIQRPTTFPFIVTFVLIASFLIYITSVIIQPKLQPTEKVALPNQ